MYCLVSCDVSSYFVLRPKQFFGFRRYSRSHRKVGILFGAHHRIGLSPFWSEAPSFCWTLQKQNKWCMRKQFVYSFIFPFLIKKFGRWTTGSLEARGVPSLSVDSPPVFNFAIVVDTYFWVIWEANTSIGCHKQFSNIICASTFNKHLLTQLGSITNVVLLFLLMCCLSVFSFLCLIFCNSFTVSNFHPTLFA